MSGWCSLMACSSSRAFCSIWSCMILLPSEHPPPRGPLSALLRLHYTFPAPDLCRLFSRLWRAHTRTSSPTSLSGLRRARKPIILFVGCCLYRDESDAHEQPSGQRVFAGGVCVGGLPDTHRKRVELLAAEGSCQLIPTVGGHGLGRRVDFLQAWDLVQLPVVHGADQPLYGLAQFADVVERAVVS